jgi:hypothetical protein
MAGGAGEPQPKPAGQPLSEAQRFDWLRLLRSESVGPRGIMAQTPLGPHNELHKNDSTT